ncbi:MarR family transcriptional regulator [Streptomyces sp. NPDC057838]|uniref:MarR family transcriptional regulator n=1 Tax=unclassified Streptomyces TaxID=2593676 RepID=UPI00369AE055
MTTTTAPSLDPRVIALAHYAGRAILESVLAGHGVTFQQSVTLRLAALADGPLERDRLAGSVTSALKTGPAEAHGVIDELVAARLLAPDGASRVRITDAGRELYTTTSRETVPFTARIYDGIPREDLAVAGRVLRLITERADAELAALSGSPQK